MRLRTSGRCVRSLIQKISSKWLAPTALIFVAGLTLGCGGVKDTLGRQAVSGEVTLDGTPLEYGTIRFEPFGASGKTTATGGIISKGRYSLGAADGLPPGKFTVSISSTGGPPKPTTTDPVEAMNAAAKEAVPEEKIPERYNTATEQVVEVEKGKPGKFDFKLTSDKK